jgi:hypothetical protein
MERNRAKIQTWVNYVFKIFDTLFLMQLDELYSTITKKTSGKIFSYGHITYAINTLKIEYPLLGNPCLQNRLDLDD